MVDAQNIEEELKSNAYFIDSVCDSIEDEIERVVRQTRQDEHEELDQEDIRGIAEKVASSGIQSL